MTAEEFQALPWQLGWSYELVAGQLVARPARAAMVALSLDLQPATPDPEVRWVRPGDVDGLEALFLEAFEGCPEYFDWTAQDLRNSAVRAVASMRTDLALVAESEGELVGALRAREGRSGPWLEPIFVSPRYHRHGWATRLLKTACAQLLLEGSSRLLSRCHLANTPSLTWHQRQGFVEMPDPLAARFRARYARHEADRLQLPELEKEAVYWEREAERMAREGVLPVFD